MDDLLKASDSPVAHDTATTRPTVSVLCVTRNRMRLLLRCLESCESQDFGPLEIVVVDNSSDDGTREQVRERFPQAQVIRLHRNIGFFPALNIAIANASGDYLMTVDDDSYFLHDDALSQLVAELRSDDSVAAVTCNIEGPREAPLVAADGDVHTFKTGFTMIRREVFDDWVGFYPDLFFRSAGESYLSSALWDTDRRVRRLASVRMYHDMAMQGRSTWHWGYHGLRSQILLVFMRSPWWMIGPSLLAKCVNGFFHFLRIRRLREWAAAWCCVWFSVPEALQYRRPIRWSTQRKLWALRQPRPEASTDACPTPSAVVSHVEH